MGEQAAAVRPTREVLQDIDSTRRRIEREADLLRNRLTPQEVFRPLTNRLKDTLGQGGERILDAFRDNPIPLTLAGIGLGWLLLKDARPSYRSSPSVRDTAPSATETMREKAESAKEALGSASGSVHEAASSVSHNVANAARKAKEAARKSVETTSDWFAETLENNPLAIAVGTLALGIVAGMAIPVTEAEEEMVGKVGEKLAAKTLDQSTATVRGNPPPQENPAPQTIPPEEVQKAALPEGGRPQGEGLDGLEV